jgi:hypothetical protein
MWIVADNLRKGRYKHNSNCWIFSIVKIGVINLILPYKPSVDYFSFVNEDGFSLYIFLHLHRMKKKQLIISISLAVTVLFSILFQSSYLWAFCKGIFQTECHHKHNGTTAQITHKHHSFDTCKVCHFTFGSYVAQKFWPIHSFQITK